MDAIPYGVLATLLLASPLAWLGWWAIDARLSRGRHHVHARLPQRPPVA